MKILVLDEWIPSICNSGKSIRTFELLSPLADRHSVTYLVNQLGKVQDEHLQKMRAAGFHVICVPRPLIYASVPSILFGTIPALFDPLPISVRQHTSNKFAEMVKRLFETNQFDVVHIEWSNYAVYTKFIHDIPTFACTHNVEYLSWQRYFETARNPFKKMLGLHEWKKMYRFEKNFYPQLDYISTVSQEDAQLVQKEFGMDRVCVIPNGVAISYYDEVENVPTAGKIVYCGSMDANVNQDAVMYFLREIFPLVLSRNPSVKFQVIGRNPPEWLLKFSSDKVSFTGSIKDVRIPLKEAMLEVVPLRIAGGSRLKILEAFAAKVPVLSTTIGAEGLDVKIHESIEIADTPAEFAAKCLELLENRNLRDKLIANGRQVVDKQYDWSRISPLVESAWNQTIQIHKNS
ncbi:MAG: glycosyltransferase family 4 protein [Planctomycetaceae bacterium]|jgi:glycosyltransferase involved in cell wall biosynthesis|nr:glycosyltransferase family 4 protein [Planctomycetaceae bacterium]